VAEPLDHVRRPGLPWRAADDDLTECGRPVVDVAAVVTAEEMQAKVARLGKTRAAMTSCMTCWSTAERNAAYHSRLRSVPSSWDTNPSEVLRRWIPYGYGGSPEAAVLDAELRAIARLIEAHREDFDELHAWETRRGGSRLRSVSDG
jgi:hypothetical protein